MSFLDSISKAIGNFGGAIASKVGLVKDAAMVSEDLPNPLSGTIKMVDEGLSAAGQAYNWTNDQLNDFYKLNVALPIVQTASAARIARRNTVQAGEAPGSLGEWQRFFSGDTWQDAESRAVQGVYSDNPDQRISPGQSVAELFATAGDKGVQRAAMSDAQFKDRYYDDKGFNLASGALDFEARWYLDPGNLLGKPLGAVGRLARFKPIQAGTDLEKEIGSTSKVGQRWESVKEGIKGKNSFQIYTEVAGLRDSHMGMALASALEKADKVPDPASRDKQLNLIGRIIYGDESAKAELSAEHAELVDQIAAAQRPTNHSIEAASQQVELPAGPNLAQGTDGEQYWLPVQVKNYYEDPYVEGEIVERLGNLDNGPELLQIEADRLQEILDLHGAATGNQLRVTGSSVRRGLRQQGVTGTKAVIRDLSEAPPWAQSTVTKGLWNLQVQVLKIPARVADSLYSMQGHGQVSLHDPAGVSELQALFDRPYFRDLDPDRKSALLSNFINATSEDQKLAAIEKAESVAFAHLAAKHGLDPKIGAKVFNEYARQKSTLRGRIRMYGGLKTRQSYSEAPDPANPGLTADTYVTEDGTVVRVPLLSTHLANNVPILDADLVNHVFKREASPAKAVADWLQDNHYSQLAFAGSQAIRRAEGFHQGLGEMGLDMMNGFNRLWKWSNLTRLGYTIRNLTDSEARAHAALGSAMVQLNVESMWHGLMNRVDDFTDGRYRIAMAAHRRDYDNLHEMEDLLTNPNLPPETKLYIQNAMKPIQRRLDAAEATHPWAVYKPPRREAGIQTIETPWGEIPAPFTEDPEDINRLLSSSQGVTARLIADGESRNMARMTSTGDWVRIEPTDPDFRAAWLDVVNKTIRQDPLAQKILSGWSDDEIVGWLSHDRDGKRLSRRMQWHASNKEEWVARARSHVEAAVPAHLREKASQQNLTGHDLDQWVNGDYAIKPTAVSGPALQFVLGQGPTANALNRTMHFTAKWLGDKPETKFARHPFYVAVYRKRAREEAERIMADPHREAAGKSMEYLDAEDLERIRKTASAEGIRQIRRTMYDAAGHSNAANQLRFVSPFMGAWEDTLRRWWTLSKDKPQVLNYFRMGFQAPQKAGLIVDQNGEVLGEGDNPDGPTYLQMRLPDWAGGAALKLGGKAVTIPISSFNVWLQSDPWWLPGFGPVVQIPVSDIVKQKPELEPIFKAVIPFGTYNDLTDALLPATGRRARSLMKGLDDRTYAGDYASLYQDALYEWDKNGRQGPQPTPQQITNETNGLYVIKVLNNIANGFPATFSSPYQFMRDGYRVLEKQGEQEHRSPDWATQQFVKKYGHSALQLIGSLSQNNAGLQPTAEAVSAYQKYEGDISAAPEFIRQIVGREGDGAFSSAAYDNQISTRYIPGSTKTMREYKDPAESMRKTNVNTGWFDYNQYLTNLDAVAIDGGLKSWRDSPVLSQMRRDFIAQMVKYNPDWVDAFNEDSTGDYQVKVDKLEKLDWARMFKKSPMRTDFQTMQQYLQQRKEYAQVLAERERAGIRGQQNNDIKKMWTDYVTGLAHSDSLFADNWFNGTLEFDPMLLDQSQGE